MVAALLRFCFLWVFVNSDTFPEICPEGLEQCLDHSCSTACPTLGNPEESSSAISPFLVSSKKSTVEELLISAASSTAFSTSSQIVEVPQEILAITRTLGLFSLWTNKQSMEEDSRISTPSQTSTESFSESLVSQTPKHDSEGTEDTKNILSDSRTPSEHALFTDKVPSSLPELATFSGDGITELFSTSNYVLALTSATKMERDDSTSAGPASHSSVYTLIQSDIPAQSDTPTHSDMSEIHSDTPWTVSSNDLSAYEDNITTLSPTLIHASSDVSKADFLVTESVTAFILEHSGSRTNSSLHTDLTSMASLHTDVTSSDTVTSHSVSSSDTVTSHSVSSSGCVRFVLKVTGNFQVSSFIEKVWVLANMYYQHSLLDSNDTNRTYYQHSLLDSNDTNRTYYQHSLLDSNDTNSALLQIFSNKIQLLQNNITLVDILFINPFTKATLLAEDLVEIFKSNNFTEEDSENTFVITDICPAVDNCGNDTMWTDEQHKPVYERNEAVFIGVVTLAAICLIVLLIGLLLIRCSKRGTWVLEHCDEEKTFERHLAFESPLTDIQITHDEDETETALTANGDHRCQGESLLGPDSPDGSAFEEDNGWVVPLEQAVASQGLAQHTENTHF